MAEDELIELEIICDFQVTTCTFNCSYVTLHFCLLYKILLFKGIPL